jgi:hypothetical protein
MGDIVATKTQTSANAYAAVLTTKLPANMHTFEVYIKENNVNAIKYKISGTYDGTNYIAIKAETVINKNAESTPEEITKPFVTIKVEIASNVAETAGNATATIAGH